MEKVQKLIRKIRLLSIDRDISNKFTKIQGKNELSKIMLMRYFI